MTSPFHENYLRHGIREYAEHFHMERNHQGLNNRLILADIRNRKPRGEIEYRERLGGMLKFYYRKAA